MEVVNWPTTGLCYWNSLFWNKSLFKLPFSPHRKLSSGYHLTTASVDTYPCPYHHAPLLISTMSIPNATTNSHQDVGLPQCWDASCPCVCLWDDPGTRDKHWDVVVIVDNIVFHNCWRSFLVVFILFMLWLQEIRLGLGRIQENHDCPGQEDNFRYKSRIRYFLP